MLLALASLAALMGVILIVALLHRRAQAGGGEGIFPPTPAAALGEQKADSDGPDFSGSDEDDNEEMDEGAADRPGLRRRRVQRPGAGLGRAGKTEARRSAKAKEKEDRRVAQQAAIEGRRAADDERAQRRADQDREQAMQREREEDAVRLLREERQRTADDEYKTWAGQIAVEQAGETAVVDHDAAIVAALTGPDAPKVIVLEELARAHSRSVEAACAIIEGLVAAKRLCGIFDERGKFIVVSPEELAKIARFVEQRGRVTLSEVAAECSNVVVLA